MCKKCLLISLILLSACSNGSTDKISNLQSPTPKKELKVDIPNASWVKIYFEGIDKNDHRAINKIIQRNDIYNLRGKVLAEGDFEIRLWVGFGKYGNDGLILKRNSVGNWTATYLSEMLCHLEKRGKYNLETPKSGWENVWQKLAESEILTLPDSSKLKYENGVLDGKSYVVETNSEYFYRIYHYPNPQHEKLKEAEQMKKIGQIIADEFGLESFSSNKGGCKSNE